MHVRVNAAMSVDGKLASRKRQQLAISDPEDFARVDELRAESDAVLVGVGTVLADDPSLTIDDPEAASEREAQGEPRHPARVVADSRARISPDATVLDGRAESYVLVSEAVPNEHVSQLQGAGATVIEAGENRVDLRTALSELEESGIETVLVEGGGEIIFSLFEAGLVDELSVFVGSILIGGRDAPTLADGIGFTESFPELELEEVSRIGNGILLQYTI
ncbi:MAG: 2,5-diamino-6-(ribosylamino)-4(3H)-pyrimidinone 5'-phosphate reductase [Halodesulfurarchaeum sp.]